MKRKYFILIIISIIVICGCQSQARSIKKDSQNQDNGIVEYDNYQAKELSNEYDVIEGKVFGVRKRMNFSQAINLLKRSHSDFSFQKMSSNDWGYDGGSETVLISKGKDNQFVLISDYSGKVLHIILLSQKFKLNDTLSMSSDVKAIWEYYPSLEMYVNEITGYEEAILADGIVLVFFTNDENRIGIYESFDSSSKPIKNLNSKPNQIVL